MWKLFELIDVNTFTRKVLKIFFPLAVTLVLFQFICAAISKKYKDMWDIKKDYVYENDKMKMLWFVDKWKELGFYDLVRWLEIGMMCGVAVLVMISLFLSISYEVILMVYVKIKVKALKKGGELEGINSWEQVKKVEDIVRESFQNFKCVSKIEHRKGKYYVNFTPWFGKLGLESWDVCTPPVGNSLLLDRGQIIPLITNKNSCLIQSGFKVSIDNVPRLVRKEVLLQNGQPLNVRVCPDSPRNIELGTSDGHYGELTFPEQFNVIVDGDQRLLLRVGATFDYNDTDGNNRYTVTNADPGTTQNQVTIKDGQKLTIESGRDFKSVSVFQVKDPDGVVISATVAPVPQQVPVQEGERGN